MSGPEVPDHVPDWVVTAAQIPPTRQTPTLSDEACLLLHLEALVALLVRAGVGPLTLDVLSGLYMDTRSDRPEPGSTRL